MRPSRFAPLAALVLAGCLASKTDIAMLQTDLQTMRAESARGDSARRAQVDQVLAQLTRANDSVRAIL